MEKYHRDDQWTNAVEQHYEHNLRRMVHLAQDARVPILLVNPVSNLRDSPPFKVEISSQLTTQQRDVFERLWETAKEAEWKDRHAKLAAVQRVLELDDRHAEAQYLLAKVYEAMGAIKLAKTAYYRAKDEDICPLRMTESMHVALQKVARQTGTPLINVRKLFEEKSENGIPGDDMLMDHVHPRIPGHQWIAEVFFNYLVDREIVKPEEGWEARKDQLFKDNFASLPPNYFPESVARLEGLKGWAAGRAARLRLQDTAEP